MIFISVFLHQMRTAVFNYFCFECEYITVLNVNSVLLDVYFGVFLLFVSNGSQGMVLVKFHVRESLNGEINFVESS